MGSTSTEAEIEVFPPIREVEIENFKSIKHLKLNCKRINVFIGEPNTGKSNILEAVVGLPSFIAHRFKLQDAVRFERLSNLKLLNRTLELTSKNML